MDKLKSSSLLVLFCLATASAYSSQKVLTIYGLENGSQLQSNGSQDYNYQLSLGAFKNHDNAVACQKHFQEKTHARIHIRFSGSVYLVVLGPFKNASELREASNQLLSKKIVRNSEPVHHVRDKEPIESPMVLKEERSFVPVVTVGGGGIWTKGGDPGNIYSTDGLVRAYVPNNSSSSGGFGELFVGAQTSLTRLLQIQAGLAVAATNKLTLTGAIWDDADPMFDNFAYQYRVQHEHILLKGKLLSESDFFVTPWIAAGFGIGFNQASQYTNRSLLSEAEPLSNFLSRHQTAFTYTFSAGVQRRISPNLLLGLGYEFTNWGAVHLGAAEDGTTHHGVYINQLATNGLLLNLTYKQV